MLQPRFCSRFYSRTRRDQYALAQLGPMDPRRLVRLHIFLQADLSIEGHPPLQLRLALVEAVPPLDENNYPWGYRSIDLGIRIYANERQPLQMVPISSLQALAIVCLVRTPLDGDALIAVSCDPDGQEPEYYLQADIETEELEEEEDRDDA